MTEEGARAWIVARFGSDAGARVAAFLDLVADENQRQNLIAPSTIATIWVRHALDSAQLMTWDRKGAWLDIGTGGGFPGMVIGLLRSEPVILIEPRRKRADFLLRCVEKLAARHVRVSASNVEKVNVEAAVISARAVASVEKLLQIAAHCATSGTRWVLPRGSSLDENTLSIARQRFTMFHVEQSLSDPASSVIVAEGERPA